MMLDSMLIAALLMTIDSDEDREFLAGLYESYKRMFYKVAIRYFGSASAEVDEAVSMALEDMCRYVRAIRRVPQSNQPAYMLSIIERACLRRMSSIARQRQMFAYDDIGDLPGEALADNSGFETIFSHTNAEDLLEAYGKKLKEREKLLIRMRHIDMMEFQEIAEALQMTEGAVRAALSRAKQRLQDEARKGKR